MSAQAATFWIDGRAADAAVLGAAQVNYGHVSTMQVRDRAVQGFGLHLRRLRDANLELFASPLDEARIRAELHAALDAAGIADASLRVLAFAPDMVMVERGEPAQVGLLVALSPPRTMPEGPMRVASHVHVRALPHLKHAATLPLLHARRSARLAGFDDALLADGDGLVCEGSLWNVGFVERGGIVWPQAPMLDGVTARLLREALAEAGIAQRHAPLRLGDCAGFDAAFACNSGGLRTISAIDGLDFAGDEGMQRNLRALLAARAWEPIIAAA